MELLEESWHDITRSQKLKWLIDQRNLNRPRIKKTLILGEFGEKAGHMIGGAI